jgi:hypothetical protein
LVCWLGRSLLPNLAFLGCPLGLEQHDVCSCQVHDAFFLLAAFYVRPENFIFLDRICFSTAARTSSELGHTIPRVRGPRRYVALRWPILAKAARALTCSIC